MGMSAVGASAANENATSSPGASGAGVQRSNAARVAASTDVGSLRKRSYSSRTYAWLTPPNSSQSDITFLSYQPLCQGYASREAAVAETGTTNARAFSSSCNTTASARTVGSPLLADMSTHVATVHDWNAGPASANGEGRASRITAAASPRRHASFSGASAADISTSATTEIRRTAA